MYQKIIQQMQGGTALPEPQDPAGPSSFSAQDSPMTQPAGAVGGSVVEIADINFEGDSRNVVEVVGDLPGGDGCEPI